MATQTVQSKKVIIIGPSETNKTKAVKQLLGTHTPNSSYKPTLGADVHQYVASSGNLYNIWDCSGNNNFRGLVDAYYMNAI